MMFGVNAQYLLQEGFNTGTTPTGWSTQDSDGDGYTWDASFLYQDDGSHSGDGMIASASYINGVGALTPDNWLISPAVNITAAATLTFWVKAQDASYSQENYSVYVATDNTVAAFTATTPVLTSVSTGAWEQKTVNLSSYVGQTIYIAFRHYNTTDMYWLDLDDVEVFVQPTTPTITVTPNSINFGTVIIGNSANGNVTLTNYNLTTDVTATTASPFAVSSNGTTFGTSATIPAAGGTLYVRYTPTAAGTSNGTVTLAATGAPNVSINLTGEALDCGDNPIPYHFDFDNAGVDCWTVLDNNNDGSTFEFATDYGYAYYIYSETNNADDWLISPTFNFNGIYHGTLDYAAASSNYPEKFQVFLIGSDNNPVALTGVVNVTNEDLYTQGFDIPSVNGAYRIGIHAVSDPDEYALIITNFNIAEGVSVNEYANETIIFPNPANNMLNINANSNINRVEVYNMMGQMVGSYTANDVNTQINTTSFANGVYTVKISTENGTTTKKFTVAR